MADLLGFDDEERIAFWTGRIVQAELDIEGCLRTAYSVLADYDGDDGKKLPWAFPQLVRELRLMVRASALDKTKVADIERVLNEVLRVHTLRNEIVHRLWKSRGEGNFYRARLGLSSGREKDETKTVQDFEDVFLELKGLAHGATSMQLMVLWWKKELPYEELDRIQHHELMNGRFRLGPGPDYDAFFNDWEAILALRAERKKRIAEWLAEVDETEADLWGEEPA
jgi:hypothetical protein